MVTTLSLKQELPNWLQTFIRDDEEDGRWEQLLTFIYHQAEHCCDIMPVNLCNDTFKYHFLYFVDENVDA